jgi:mono/diheme cytochrome c family protein
MGRRRTWCAPLTLVALLTIASRAHSRPDPSDEELFRSRCASCHGADGKANTPAGHALGVASWEHSKKLEAMSDSQIANLIRAGAKKNGVVTMPAAADLTAQQIQGLVGYVRALEKR